jgi:hypothetical protein
VKNTIHDLSNIGITTFAIAQGLVEFKINGHPVFDTVENDGSARVTATKGNLVIVIDVDVERE